MGHQAQKHLWCLAGVLQSLKIPELLIPKIHLGTFIHAKYILYHRSIVPVHKILAPFSPDTDPEGPLLPVILGEESSDSAASSACDGMFYHCNP